MSTFLKPLLNCSLDSLGLVSCCSGIVCLLGGILLLFCCGVFCLFGVVCFVVLFF